MNKPIRLRTILVNHLTEINPNIRADKIDALEEDIKAFVKSIIHGSQELGLKVECEDFIGDLD